MKTYRFFILSFLLLAGCASQHPTPSPTPTSPHQQQQNQLERLKQGGVHVILLGDELRLVLPARRFFVKDTYTLKPASTLTLDEIVDFLNPRKNFGINVLAYTPSLGLLDDLKPDTGLEQQQAQTIVDYLLQNGLDTRLITATAWTGVSDRQKHSAGGFSDDSPDIFSVEIRARLLPQTSKYN